jgi:hypothetical protein
MFRRALSAIILLAAATAFLLEPSLAATYTVTNCNDSGAGSLRQAITDANAAAGSHTIAFNIPNTDPGYQTAGGASWWRITLISNLPWLSKTIKLDGSTQTANQGDTNPYGPEIELYAGNALCTNGLELNAAACEVISLCIGGFSSNGICLYQEIASGSKITGCYLGTNATGESAHANHENGIYLYEGTDDVVIGGSAEAERNLISGNTKNGIYLFGDIRGYVQHNLRTRISGNYIGTNRTGAAALPNGHNGINIGTCTLFTTVGGPAAGERNVISGNSRNGILNGEDNAGKTHVINNLIGLTASGLGSLGNGRTGLSTQNGGLTIEANIISGNALAGVLLMSAEGSQVSNNYIGTDLSGTAAVPNANAGIILYGSANNTVGQDNIIAFNGPYPAYGIIISGETAVNNRITRNSLFQNADLGICLIYGGNRSLPYPVITSAVFAAGNAALNVTGTATPAARVELFRTEATPDATGRGEGKTYLGYAEASAAGAWSAALAGVAGGGKICATAIDLDGNTSEFSVNYAVPTTTTSTSTTTTTSTTSTTTIPIPSGRDFSPLQMMARAPVVGGYAVVDLTFSSRISGPVDCVVHDISASPPRILGSFKVSIAAGNNILSLPTNKEWAGKVVRITFVHGGISYSVKGLIPIAP